MKIKQINNNNKEVETLSVGKSKLQHTIINITTKLKYVENVIVVSHPHLGKVNIEVEIKRQKNTVIELYPETDQEKEMLYNKDAMVYAHGHHYEIMLFDYLDSVIEKENMLKHTF